MIIFAPLSINDGQKRYVRKGKRVQKKTEKSFSLKTAQNMLEKQPVGQQLLLGLK